MRSRQTRRLQQNGQNLGFAVEMTLGGTYNGILADDLPPVPPSLETRTRHGFPHFHSDDGGGMLAATCPGPNKIGGPPDSCTEPKFHWCDCDLLATNSD